MISTLFLVTALATQADFEVAPRELEWKAVERGVFDPQWILPDETGDARDRRLLAAMRELAVVEFMDRGEPRCFGDLVAEAQGVSPAAREAWLGELEKRSPRLMRRWGPALRELLLDDYLFSDKWSPAKDHPRDGILMSEGWELEERPNAAWRKVRTTPRFEQGATLYNADLETIKQIENDYRGYPSNVGADYEEIYPLQGEHYRGEDARGEPFSAMQIYFECDLPFPFSTYECNLRILNRIDEDGQLRADIYSASPDFYYMAGQDVFLPVKTSEGETVAYLVVRDFGFDLSGVPDGPKHRAEALRSTLGNMKRNSERSFQRRAEGEEEAFTPPATALGTIRVRGRK